MLERIYAAMLRTVNTCEQLNDKLITASTFGKSYTARSILIAGADPNYNQSEALRCAVQYGHTNTVDILLEYGANPRTISENALSLAAWNGYAKIINAIQRATRATPPSL